MIIWTENNIDLKRTLYKLPAKTPIIQFIVAVSCHFFVELEGKFLYQRTETLSINYDLVNCWAEHEFSAGHEDITYSRLEVMGIGGSLLS